MLAVQRYSIVKAFEKYKIDPSILRFKSYSKNEIRFYNFIARLPLSDKFRIEERNIVTLEGYSYYFEIIRREIKYFGSYDVEINFSPGSEKLESQAIIEFNSGKEKYNWKSIYPYVELWASLTSNEILSIGYIDRVINQIKNVSDNSQIDDRVKEENFTRQEKIIIIEKIELLKRGVETELNLDDYKLNLIIKKLDDLKIKIDSQNKFDFKSSLYGLMINLTSSVVYDNSGKFISLFKSIFTSNLLK